MSNILITGIAGFIGFHLQQKLLNHQHLVSGIDSLEKHKTASILRASLMNQVHKKSIHANFLDELDEKPDTIIHLAAETGIAGSLNNPDLYYYQNVEGTRNVLEQCLKNKVKYLIYASSSSVYEPNQAIMNEDAPHEKQVSYYGVTKNQVEKLVDSYCKKHGLIAIGLRFFTVYGSWTRPDMAAYKFMTAISNNEHITLYNQGEISRDFTHVSDIVQAISLLCEQIQNQQLGSHHVFNIGSGRPVSVLNYAQLIAKNLGKSLYFTTKVLPENELAATYSDTTNLEKFIQFKPVCTIESGIEEMCKWFQKTQLKNY